MTRSAPGLDAWLKRLEARTPESRIELGLDRIGRVMARLAPDLSGIPVITVAGTNGKGSVVRFLESIYTGSGRRSLAYTSPHILRFNERIHIGGRPARDRDLVAALEAVETAREDEDLTYFEHVTLAALWLAAREAVDVLILEVGLGGRLDAVNVLDADVAVITSIGLDHAEWLGRKRSEVAREKAGIARAGRPVIIGEKDRPAALDRLLSETGAVPLRAGRELRWRRTARGVDLNLAGHVLKGVRPGIAGRHQHGNAACAALAVRLLDHRLAIDDETIGAGLAAARIRGRFERIGEHPEVIVDVAHNPAAARTLKAMLREHPLPSRAVVAILGDKDVAAIGRTLNDEFIEWFAAGLPGPRKRSGEDLARALSAAPVAGRVEALESVPQALDRALSRSAADERVVVFGSFQTVAAACRHLNQ